MSVLDYLLIAGIVVCLYVAVLTVRDFARSRS